MTTSMRWRTSKFVIAPNDLRTGGAIFQTAPRWITELSIAPSPHVSGVDDQAPLSTFAECRKSRRAEWPSLRFDNIEKSYGTTATSSKA